MMYQFIIDKSAAKFIGKQSKEQQERILVAIYGLPNNGDIKPMRGRPNFYRLRVGTYRIIFTIENSVLTVRVTEAGNRGDIYK